MHRLAFLALTTMAACSDKYDPNPLEGEWRVDRMVGNATGCSSLTLPQLLIHLHPGYEKEFDLGMSEIAGSNNVITSDHVIFTTGELVFGSSSDRLIIEHDLKIQIYEPRLVGTASADGNGTQAGCHWSMSAVAEQLSN